MQTATEIHEAFLHAERLRTEPSFQMAVTAMRKEAVEVLVSVDPTDIEKIRETQALVRAIDGLATHIGHAILRWQALPPNQQKQALGN